MKKRNVLALFSLIVLNANLLFATDRVVQQNGAAGSYTSITAAIIAAADGDNIVINNRTDGLPWIENLTIGKSLTFVSAADNVQWWMEGTISITMGEGRSITIVGLKNTSATGHITKTGSTPTNRTAVNILYSDIAGNITLVSGINFYLGSSKVSDVTFSFGRIFGNDLRTLVCNADAVATEDVNQIIGNRIGSIGTNSQYAYTHNCNTQYLFYSNNLAGTNSTSYGGYINALKAGATTNKIVNSVFKTRTPSTGTYNVSLRIDHTTGQLNVENNILCGILVNSSTFTNGIQVTNINLTTCTYNMFYNGDGSVNPAMSTALNNFSSTSAYPSNIGSDGSVSTGTMHIDAGTPSNAYLDLDLSRNDVGVFGGSYSMANFLPLMNNTESARVNYMNTPRIVNQGGTVNVQVIGFDK